MELTGENVERKFGKMTEKIAVMKSGNLKLTLFSQEKIFEKVYKNEWPIQMVTCLYLARFTLSLLETYIVKNSVRLF